MLFCNYFTTSQICQNIATEALKKTEKSLFNGFIIWFLSASVAKKINLANRLRHTIHFKSVPKILMLSLFQTFINTKLRELYLQSPTIQCAYYFQPNQPFFSYFSLFRFPFFLGSTRFLLPPLAHPRTPLGHFWNSCNRFWYSRTHFRTSRSHFWSTRSHFRTTRTHFWSTRSHFWTTRTHCRNSLGDFLATLFGVLYTLFL